MTDNGYVVDIEGPDGIAETTRIGEQGRILTKAIPLIDLCLPDGALIVDLACGAGELALLMGKRYPQAQVVGIDINEKGIAYCNDQAQAQCRDNVEFRVGNILDRLPFEDESVDSVMARLIFGVLPKEYWPSFLEECERILKPGGTLSLTEPSATLIQGAPALHELSLIMHRALWKAGKSFSEYELAVSPALNQFLKKSHFVDVQCESFLLDYSAGSPLHAPIADDFAQLISHMLKPLIKKYGDISDPAYNKLVALSLAELDSEGFSSQWGIVRYRAKKKVA